MENIICIQVEHRTAFVDYTKPKKVETVFMRPEEFKDSQLFTFSGISLTMSTPVVKWRVKPTVEMVKEFYRKERERIKEDFIAKTALMRDEIHNAEREMYQSAFQLFNKNNGC